MGVISPSVQVKNRLSLEKIITQSSGLRSCTSIRDNTQLAESIFPTTWLVFRFEPTIWKKSKFLIFFSPISRHSSIWTQARQIFGQKFTSIIFCLNNRKVIGLTRFQVYENWRIEGRSLCSRRKRTKYNHRERAKNP